MTSIRDKFDQFVDTQLSTADAGTAGLADMINVMHEQMLDLRRSVEELRCAQKGELQKMSDTLGDAGRKAMAAVYALQRDPQRADPAIAGHHPEELAALGRGAPPAPPARCDAEPYRSSLGALEARCQSLSRELLEALDARDAHAATVVPGYTGSPEHDALRRALRGVAGPARRSSWWQRLKLRLRRSSSGEPPQTEPGIHLSYR